MVYIILTTLLISCFGIYFFYKKVYLDFEIVCEFPNIRNGEFYPDAYVFFHSQQSIDNFFELISETRKIKSFIPKEIVFDFTNYSYCIFYGRKVENMYYSYKTTYFDDPSPSYASCRKYGKKCVFVKYFDQRLDSANGIFLYRVNKDEKLSGFNGE